MLFRGMGAREYPVRCWIARKGKYKVHLFNAKTRASGLDDSRKIVYFLALELPSSLADLAGTVGFLSLAFLTDDWE